MNLDDYLTRIDFREPVLPTYATLAALLRAHVCSVPFENLDFLDGADGVCSNQGSTLGGVDCSIFGCLEAPRFCPCNLEGGEVCAAGSNTCALRLPSWQILSEGLFLQGGRNVTELTAEVRGFYDDYEAERIVVCQLTYGEVGRPENLSDINPDHPALERCIWKPLSDFPREDYGPAIDECIAAGQGELCGNNGSHCEGNRDNSVSFFGPEPECAADWVFRSPPPDTRPDGLPRWRMSVMRFPELPCRTVVADADERTVDFEYIIYDLSPFAR